ncbi:HTH-type transcriptional regulator GltC [bioreactor metagenome]|uniref:HTH-type transcriptional regulator GltC n=1 Tax=bioreactor metagenome TaxID=1076179 RepID=A0A644XWJ4_9ZZZZ
MADGRYDAFIKTVELGSLTKAAEVLGYTQSGISHMLAGLEAELGATLLLRDRSGVRLTPEGAALLPQVQAVCASSRELADAAASLRGMESGVVRIGAFSSVSCHILPPLIKSFLDSHPGISFELLQSDYPETERWVAEGRVDFGFLGLYPRRECDVIPLLRNRVLAVLPARHPMAKEAAFPLSRLAEEPFIALDEGNDYEIRGVLAQNNLTPRTVFRVRDDYTIMSMVEAGLGVSLLPELVLRRCAYKVTTLPLDPPAFWQLGVILRDRSRMSAASRAFLRHLTDSLRVSCKWAIL